MTKRLAYGVFLTGAIIIIYLSMTIPNKGEVVVLWGQQGSDCVLWVIDPSDKRDGLLPVLTKELNCDPWVNNSDAIYSLINTENSNYLIYLQKDPPLIERFLISEKGDLSLVESIPLQEIDTAHGFEPQWKTDTVVFLAGSKNGREGVYHFDLSSQKLVGLLHAENIFAPILSPTKSHLLYGFWTRENGYYFYLKNLETNKVTDITSYFLDDESRLFCFPQWSPNGQYIVFSLGCEPPYEYAIINVDDMEVAFFEHESVMGITGWLSNDRFVYGQIDYTLGRNGIYVQKVYSLTEFTAKNLVHFAEWENFSDITVLDNFDWTSDSQRIVASAAYNYNEYALFVADISQPDHPVINIFPIAHDIQKPIWSPSGNFIAYYGTEDNMQALYIVDDKGYGKKHVEMQNLFRPKYKWVLVNK